ncbi:MAG: ABC transporter ATP-binding protein [Candidatus Heimdallarchaeota archaeon]|nr:MAG: ABC transporter ATP-binding protein [Candidatus Heimdallarchaeota archaeon]
MAFLECQDLIKLYVEEQSKIQVPALRGIELTANEGDLIAIIGPSGSGKSTLVNLIGGIDRPSSGDIILGDSIITKMTTRQLTKYRRHRVGFLYQLPERNLVWNLTALKNVMLPMKLAGLLTHGEQKQRAQLLLKEVGLERRGNHKPPQLSGGEAQRAGIAVALANDPEIVLADEPTGELDSITTFKIIDYFKFLNKSLGKTFLVVTHDHRFANMTNKALRILDGRIVGLHRAIDPKKSLSAREEVIFVDDHGNLRLPDEIRRQAGIKNHIQIEMRDGFATLIPVRGDIESE